MRLWRARISVVVLAVMLLAVGRLGAQDAEEPAEYPSFAELCREAEEGGAARVTVAVLLERARTTDCVTARG